jgi:hypothetical protein
MVASNLMGFIRKSKSGNALKVNISTAAFKHAVTYSTSNGREYVQLIVPISSLKRVLDGEREYAAVSQLLN